MKLRQGRKNPLNLYVQMDAEPSDDDLSIGYIRNLDVAHLIVQAFDEAPWMCERLEGIIVRGDQ